MYLCASNPHAAAGRGTTANSVHKSSTTQAFRIRLLYRPDKFAQGAQVPRIPRIHVAPPARGAFELRRFQQHRQIEETRVVQQPPERFEAKASLADVLVAIDPASTWLLRVVQMEDADAIEPDNLGELTE